MFIVKMEGFAGFVGLMFGLVVLSVIITLVVCAVKRHRREWLQDGQRSMGRVFRCTKEYSRSSTVRFGNATS